MNTSAASLAPDASTPASPGHLPDATPQPFDPLQLRRALGSFGTGVTVVSTLAADGRLVGVTANSFSSVSLDPPIVLWSLNRSSPSLGAFDGCGRFVVNVLSLDQLAVSRRFASPVPDKFDGIAHRRGMNGLPVIDDCAATFECATVQRIAVGDHILFLGRIERFSHTRHAGLLYCHGRYAQGVGLDQADSGPR